MADYRRLLLLVLIMTGVAIAVGLTALAVFYDAAFERERQRLVNFAESQARLMVALGPAGLPQVLEDQRRLREEAAGQSAELQLARREGESIVFLTPARGSDQPRAPVTFRGPAAEPMTQALLGRSGTMIGRDYADRRVLAAFEPLPALGLGLVAKIDMAEINGRYLRAGLVAGFVSLVAVVGAALLFIQLGEPMIRRMRESESRYRALFENMDLGVVVYQSLAGGENFAFKDFNRAAEQISQLGRQQVVNKRLTDMFPGAEEFGAIEVMRRVWQTGRPERLPTRYYRDERIAGWWDVYVYKLPTGEIVTLFADVSERERQAEALRQSEARYRNLVEAQPDPICQFLPDTTLTFVNHAYAQFYGTEPQELIGKRWLDFAAPDERPRFLEELSSFTPEHPQRQEETSSTRIDQDVRWYLCHLYSFFDDAGHIISFQTFGTDITARKRAEEQLAQQIDLLTAITDSAADAIFVSDGEERITFMNPAAERIFGWSREELMGRKVHDAIHHRYPDGRPFPASECPLRRVYAIGETLVGHEDVFFRKDGSPVPVACSNAPLKIDGRIAGAVLVAHDITQRKKAEEALRASEARLRLFIETAPVAIAMFDCNMRYLAASRRFCSDYRLDSTNLVGRSHYEVFPDMSDRWREVHRRCLEGAVERSDGDRFDRADGSVDWVRWEIQPWRTGGGQIGGLTLFSEDISERRRTEEALHESETRLRRAVEQAPFPIMVHAEDGKVVHLSQSWPALTGYDRSEIGTVADWTERAYGDCEGAVRAKIDQLYALDGPLDEGERVIRTADGRLRVWTFSSAPLGRDGCGRRLVVSMASDVTARKEAERALSESENRMRALLDASQDEILLLGIEGDVLAINKAAEHRLARRANGAHLIGARLDRLLSHDQAESRLTRVREVAATRNALHCEVPVRSRWFDFWYYPVVLPDKPVTEVAVYAREVTEQKKLLADLSKLFQALQQSPMSVIITDREGTIEYVNPEFTKVTGYTTEEAIGQNPRILKSGRMPPELYEELWQTITGGGVWRGELLNKKKNGELYWELASIGAVKEGGKLSNFVAVKEDITARREMEEQLRQSQKMQVVGQLTGGIAHDFNNLLAIVIGNVQLLRERLGSDDAKAREYLDDALWSARRAGELTHRLLAFARKQPLKPSVIDLNDVVRGMSELLRRTLGAQIHIEESLAADVWKAVADRGELERVIINLAVNSRDAMPTSGTLSLETRNALLDEDYCEQYEEVRPGEYVLLAVTDTGVGMSPEIVQRVFEPFFTTKEIGEGSGLGLSMVYGFVKQSGGHISIYSRVGHGTSVKIYLPRVPSSPDGWADDPSDATAGDFGSHVVLVVEDEPKLRKAAVKMLERLGLRGIQAENGKDAVELFAAAHPDVLFTDIELPGGMSGTDLAEAVRELDPNIKVLFTTGYAREAVLHERWLEEKVPWLLKPYSHLDLARELRALVGSHGELSDRRSFQR